MDRRFGRVSKMLYVLIYLSGFTGLFGRKGLKPPTPTIWGKDFVIVVVKMLLPRISIRYGTDF